MHNTDHLIIRRATPGDAIALQRLAALDSRAPLPGDVLLAESGGHPLAALSLATGAAAADPFTPTADVVELLRRRAGQLHAARGRAPLARVRRRRALLGN